MVHNLEEAHARFCRGDAEAFAAIAASLLGSWQPPRARWLGDVEEQAVQESIEDALLAYWVDPAIFDAGRGVPLAYFLGRVAEGYLANRVRKERRQRVQALQPRAAPRVERARSRRTRPRRLRSGNRRRGRLECSRCAAGNPGQ